VPDSALALLWAASAAMRRGDMERRSGSMTGGIAARGEGGIAARGEGGIAARGDGGIPPIPPMPIPPMAIPPMAMGPAGKPPAPHCPICMGMGMDMAPPAAAAAHWEGGMEGAFDRSEHMASQQRVVCSSHGVSGNNAQRTTSEEYTWRRGVWREGWIETT
jgi:hypothetical protein